MSAAPPLGLLLLEDSPADSRLLVESLRDRVQDGSLVIQTVRRLADALRELKRFRFSCVLVDLGLPDGQGVANVARIREADPDVAIVVLTGLSDQAAAEEAFRLGAQDYLIKGERLGEDLLGFVEKAVAKRAAPRETAPPAKAATETVLHYRPWVDPARGRFTGVNCTTAEAWHSGSLTSAVAGLATDVAQWKEGGLAPTEISLPLKTDAWAVSCNDLHAAVLETGLSPEQLCVRVAIAELAPTRPAVQALQRLRGAGFRVWLEGWTPEQAPLDLLSAQTWDGLVIDMQTLTHLAADPARRFLRATHAACGALGLDLIIEGVDGVAQTPSLAWLSPRRVGGEQYCGEQTASVLPLRWRRGPAE